MTTAQDLRVVALDLDRAADAELGGPPDQTMSQSVGIALLAGVWWGKPVSWCLSTIMNERHHAVRALYGDDGAALFPERMPDKAPKSTPYPGAPIAVW